MSEHPVEGPPTAEQWDTEMERIVEALRPGRNVQDFTVWQTEVRRQHGHHPYRRLRRAVNLVLTQVDEFPPPQLFGMFLREAERQLEAEDRKALPPPPPPPPQGTRSRMSGPERAAFTECHIAIGKLLARAGRRLPSGYPGEGGEECGELPSEEDIAAVVTELRRTGQFRTTLDRIARGEPDPLRGIGTELGRRSR